MIPLLLYYKNNLCVWNPYCTIHQSFKKKCDCIQIYFVNYLILLLHPKKKRFPQFEKCIINNLKNF